MKWWPFTATWTVWSRWAAKGYPKDCPRPEIFKMKEFLVQKKYKKSLFAAGNWQKQVAKDAQLAKPFNDFLNYAFEELHTQ